MSRIDLSKLPPPQLIEELDFEVILGEMRERMRTLCPEWTGYELESDPANKIMEVCAYREMLLRQRVNEAARAVMVPFASGADLDNLAAFYPVTRLPGAAATFRASLKLSAALDVGVSIPSGFTVVGKNGAYEARLMEDIVIPAGAASREGLFEILRPAGAEGNGLSLAWDAITPLPFVTTIEQLEASHGGGDPERDDAFRVRAPERLEGYSTAGPTDAYAYHAKSADERVADVSVTSPTPGVVDIYLLSGEGDGTADAAMIRRVYDKLSAKTVRPLDDKVGVYSAEIVPYEVKMTVVLYAGVSGHEPLAEARRGLSAKIQELRGIHRDITRTALIASAHVEGVKEIELPEPAEDIRISESQAAYCVNIEVGSRVSQEP